MFKQIDSFLNEMVFFRLKSIIVSFSFESTLEIQFYDLIFGRKH